MFRARLPGGTWSCGARGCGSVSWQFDCRCLLRSCRRLRFSSGLVAAQPVRLAVAPTAAGSGASAARFPCAACGVGVSSRPLPGVAGRTTGSAASMVSADMGSRHFKRCLTAPGNCAALLGAIGLICPFSFSGGRFEKMGGRTALRSAGGGGVAAGDRCPAAPRSVLVAAFISHRAGLGCGLGDGCWLRLDGHGPALQPGRA